MRRLLAVSLSCGLLSLAFACAEKDEHPPPAQTTATPPVTGGGSSSSGGTSGTSGTSGTTDAGACNDSMLPTALVEQLATPGDPAPFVGGNVVEGSYELTSAQVYVGSGSGPTGVSFREGLVVSGATVNEVSQVQRPGDGGTPVTEDPTRSTLEFIVSGSNITLTPTCPLATSAKVYAFTATATQLVLYDSVSRTQSTFIRR